MQWDTPTARVPWVDYAKGICIVMVVMLHSTLGVEAAAGQSSWMHEIVEFAAPFRMPDFFLIAGLFLARRIDRSWPDYLDRKVLHFVYFYLLWLTVQFAFKSPLFVSELGIAGVIGAYFEALIDPFGTLWFVYMLPIFFVVSKLLRAAAPGLVWALAALLNVAGVESGISVVDYFANYFVFFYSGYVFAPHIFRVAERLAAERTLALAGLAVWASLNGYSVETGLTDWRVVNLLLGFAGAGAIVTVSVLLARIQWADALRYCGENSIVIYLAFTIPMAVTRIVLLKFGLVSDLGTVALLVTTAGILGALTLFWIVRNTPLAFLFERPGWARLAPANVVGAEALAGGTAGYRNPAGGESPAN